MTADAVARRAPSVMAVVPRPVAVVRDVGVPDFCTDDWDVAPIPRDFIPVWDVPLARVVDELAVTVPPVGRRVAARAVSVSSARAMFSPHNARHSAKINGVFFIPLLKV